METSMQIDSIKDTIAAVATAPGVGAIAIVRLSGPQAREIGEAIAPVRRPTVSHQMTVVEVHDGQELLDHGMKVEMHGPRSFTGEDVVELHLHGSRVVAESVLQACLAHGARLARAGEFSLRAFINGRMDLSQAEAVADLISSGDATGQRIANAQLQGKLSAAVRCIINLMEGVLARWRVALDFPEYLDGDEPQGGEDILEDCRTKIQWMIDRARVDLGKGLMVVLCGAPNVGKSTLLNALAGEERVLVDAASGTTRDPIEVEVGSGARRFRVWDTAGVSEQASGLEARGIAMSKERMAQADLRLWLVASDAPVWPTAELDARVVVSKTDLAEGAALAAIRAQAQHRGLQVVGEVSAVDGHGIDELTERICGRAVGEQDEVVVVRQRHLDALCRAQDSLAQAEKMGLTLDVRGLELERATKSLGNILGINVDAEVLDQIFSDFCIGK